MPAAEEKTKRILSGLVKGERACLAEAITLGEIVQVVMVGADTGIYIGAFLCS